MSRSRPLRLCLAASGGGHLRQLLDLEPAWSFHDHVFVTEDTALGRSLAARYRVSFVPHFAFGQARLGRPGRMIVDGWRNLVRSAHLVAALRPDVVITTGAGAVFFVSAFARLAGAKIVAIESFARFEKPSLFGRLIGRLATVRIVQAPPLLRFWPDALLFDPFKEVDGVRPPKQPLTFVTVGATLPFPRMTDAVLDLKRRGGLPGQLLVQAGADADRLNAGSLPPETKVVADLDFEEMQRVLAAAETAICHGGTGSIITALRAGCRTVVVPRRFDLQEHYDDHQEQVTGVMAQRGLLAECHDTGELADAVARAHALPERMATTDHGPLAEKLRVILAAWATERR